MMKKAVRRQFPSSPQGQSFQWSQQTIRTHLRAFAQSGEAMNSRKIRQTHRGLFSAAIYWFGSYRAAIESAGIDYANVRLQNPNRWSKEAIIRELRLLRRRGARLNHNAIGQEIPELVAAAYRYFGTYRRAVEAAGFDYLKVRVRPQRSWNRRRILSEIRHLKKSGNGMWARSVRATHPYLPRVAKAYFGSYPAAARAAGVAPAAIKPPPYRFWSAEQVTDALKKLANRNARVLAPTRMRKEHPYLVRVAARRFGSYRKAVEAAGIDYPSIARVYAPSLSGEVVTARLRALQERGKDLRYSSISHFDPRLMNAARRRFGSYEKAMKAAGIAYPPLKPISHWTEPLILNTIRDLHRAKVDLRYAKMKRNYSPLYEAARYYFGFYTNAVRTAGIDYDRVVQEQLKKQRSRNSPRKLAVAAK